MAGSATTRLRNSGTRCFLGGRRPLRVILHPLSSLDITANQMITSQHYFSLHPMLCKRSIQNHPTLQSNEANKGSHQNQLLPSRRQIISDPTANRPTQKCDPYGLGGKSLSLTNCLNLISTLEDGWKLLFESRENSNDGTTIHNHNDSLNSDEATTTTASASPTHLQKYYYHPTFYDASKFTTHIALLATNHNHFPHLSIDRILVENMNNYHPFAGTPGNLGNDHDGGIKNHDIDNIQHGLLEGRTMERKATKVKGWIFRSSVRCSTYRPSSSFSNTISHSFSEKEECKGKSQKVNISLINGLTYHDFHLAMSIDVEVNREDVKRWLWCSSSSSSSSDADD